MLAGATVFVAVAVAAVTDSSGGLFLILFGGTMIAAGADATAFEAVTVVAATDSSGRGLFLILRFSSRNFCFRPIFKKTRCYYCCSSF